MNWFFDTQFSLKMVKKFCNAMQWRKISIQWLLVSTNTQINGSEVDFETLLDEVLEFISMR